MKNEKKEDEKRNDLVRLLTLITFPEFHTKPLKMN